MNDKAVLELARRAGLAVEWTDYANKRHQVALDSIRRILAALGLPCESASDLSHSRQLLGREATPALVTATAGAATHLPISGLEAPLRARLFHEDGTVAELVARPTARGVTVPAIKAIGYHTLEIGQTRLTLAVAPTRCVTIEDIAPGGRLAGLAVQIYGLRSVGDCGIGHMGGVAALAEAAGRIGVDALALSPTHALFTADHSHFSPYSPSSRLFYNPLLADAACLFGQARIERAGAVAQLRASARALETLALIDWPKSGLTKMAILRCLFEDFVATDLAVGATTELASDFASFRRARGASLEQHAVFEALQATRVRADPQSWNWREWPSEWRDPHSPAVRSFAKTNQHEVLFHIFLQWITERSIAAAQKEAKLAGMRIGLIADLAVGMNRNGSYAWNNQDDILGGLEIGAPPDLFNPGGQNWGLTTFSPRAVVEGGFAPFIATLRACMRHAGGLRIDHAMGLMRLWVTPAGATPGEGAYLAYPLDDLFRLIALESHRHSTIVIGEDLGTVPAGFRDRLTRAGIYGMSVLWFERDGNAFAAPSDWPTEAVAMTSTHDLPTVVGWWRGHDLKMRAKCGLLEDIESEQTERSKEREALLNALRSAKIIDGNLRIGTRPSRVVDAAVKFIAATPSRLALLPLEDALAVHDQPNVPGTIDKCPNWRRRYAGEAVNLLNPPDVRHRIDMLANRGAP
jgi:4-alpha-glucanotransferase